MLSDSAPTFECAALVDELTFGQRSLAQNLLKYSKSHVNVHMKTRHYDCLEKFAMDDLLLLETVLLKDVGRLF